jgi:hypothetical protein
MPRQILSLLALAALPLGGCTALGGPDILGSVLGGSTGAYGAGAYGRGGPDMRTMAVDTCGAEASRYGRVGITQVQQVSRSTLRVYGTIDSNYRRHSFACSFREDGRITDFDVN